MRAKKYIGLQLGIVVLLLVACTPTPTPTALPEIHTQLLVRAPDTSLPLNKSIEVISRTDAAEGVSHVELYAELPTGEKKVLVRSDAASLYPTTFTTSQEFIPRQAGHYVIWVVGYSQSGKNIDISNAIGFDAQ